MKVKVENMRSPRTGNPVANQFRIQVGSTRYFQSYTSIIVRITPKKITLDRHYWDYSSTTSRYRNEFLGETTRETQRKIDSGEYRLADLNK